MQPILTGGILPLPLFGICIILSLCFWVTAFKKSEKGRYFRGTRQPTTEFALNVFRRHDSHKMKTSSWSNKIKSNTRVATPQPHYVDVVDDTKSVKTVISGRTRVLSGSKAIVTPKRLEQRMESQPRVTVTDARSQLRRQIIPVRPRVLWPLVEPFEYWCLPVYPCAKLSLQLLRKVMIYTRTKDYFPFLSMKNWIHICMYKLKFSEDYAWMYIRLFDVVRQHMCRDDDEFNYWDRKCDTLSQIKKDKNMEFSVPTLEFLLFLYIQHSFRIMNKTRKDVISTPVTERESQNSLPVETTNEWMFPPEQGDAYILGELDHLSYLKTYFSEIITFLQLSDGSSGRVSLDIVCTLNLIIGGALYRHGGATLLKIEEFLSLSDVSTCLDFNPEENTVDREWFIEWVLLKLQLYPLGTNLCRKRCLARNNIQTGTWESGALSIQFNRLGGNYQNPPHAWFIISQVNEQVLCKDDLVPYCNLKVHRCNNSYIYVPAVFNNVIVEKCYNTTVYLGCASKILRFVDCNRCYFTGQGRQVVVHDCVTCGFNLHTPCQIIMSGLHTSELVFGPYATYYPKLRDHMMLAHLGPEPSHWCTVVGVADPAGQAMETAHRWDYLPPQDFSEFGYPFEMEGETKCNPIELPQEYLQHKCKLKLRFNLWKKQIDSAHLDPASQRLVHETMYERFKFYLEANDHDFELDGLKSIINENLEKKSLICQTQGSDDQDSSQDSQSPDSFSEEFNNSQDDQSGESQDDRCINNRSPECTRQVVANAATSEISLNDSDNSDIEGNSDDEEGDVFLNTEEAFSESEYDTFMKERIAELVTRPLSADFDASGRGIEDIQLGFFSSDNSGSSKTPPESR